jgi:hypothetical protein
MPHTSSRKMKDGKMGNEWIRIQGLCFKGCPHTRGGKMKDGEMVGKG